MTMLDTTNYPNLETWLRELETTTELQTRHHLVSHVDYDEATGSDVLAYCCLGIGERCRDATSEYLAPGVYSLPPHQFQEWLGIGSGPLGVRRVEVDWMPASDPYWWRNTTSFGSGEYVTADGLNDVAGLTFAQIAQVIRYFGLRALPVSVGGGAPEEVYAS